MLDMGLTLFVVFAVSLLLSVPISISLGIASIIALTLHSNLPLVVVAQKIYSGLLSFPLLAIPFFILAGNIMSISGASKKLVDLANCFFGRITGGLALVTTAACTFFGAISGSSNATAAAIGSVMIDPMQEKGYSKPFAAATIASSGPIGIIIPPSVPLVLYGVGANTSIGKLFLGGILPGIMMCVAFMILQYFYSKKFGYGGDEPVGLRETVKCFKESLLSLMMPIIILGGIYGGIFTATEAAAVAVIYGFIIGAFVYKTLNIQNLSQILLRTALSTGTILYLVATSKIFSYILTVEQIPQKISTIFLSISSNPTIIMFLISGLLLVVGTFLDNTGAIVLLTPVLYPLISSLGINLVYFGVIMVFVLAVGQITPPVGMCLFVTCDIADISLEKLSKACIPYLMVLLFLMVLLILFPVLITAIPDMAM